MLGVDQTVGTGEMIVVGGSIKIGVKSHLIAVILTIGVPIAEDGVMVTIIATKGCEIQQVILISAILARHPITN